MSKLIIPFTFTKDMNAVEICELLEKHSISIGAQTSYTKNEYLISGYLVDLTKFIAEVESDAPAKQWVDYVYENQVAAV